MNLRMPLTAAPGQYTLAQAMNPFDHDPARRLLLRQALAIAGAAALTGATGCATTAAATTPGAAPLADPHPALGRTLTRIAFGSCAKAGEDAADLGRDPRAASSTCSCSSATTSTATRATCRCSRRSTRQLAANPASRACANDARARDLGRPRFRRGRRGRRLSDEGRVAADLPRLLGTSRRGSPRRERDGVYGSYVFGPPGRRVQVILPDLRYNRTPHPPARTSAATEYEAWAKQKARGRAQVPGPYARNPDRQDATMLGERQWQWLEQQLKRPPRCDLRLEPAGARRLRRDGKLDRLCARSPAPAST